jgi:hypothetical protein
MGIRKSIANTVTQFLIKRRDGINNAIPAPLRIILTELQSQHYVPSNATTLQDVNNTLPGVDAGIWETYAGRVYEAIRTKGFQNVFDSVDVRTLIHSTSQRLGKRYFKEILSYPDAVRFCLLDFAREFPMWGSVPFFEYPSATFTSIHHSYHFGEIYKFTGKLPPDFNSVLDFGGGYGRMAAALVRMGCEGVTIIDLPVMQHLQMQYIADVSRYSDFRNINLNSHIHWYGEIDEVERKADKRKDLFTAFWSLSETPLHVRNKVMERLEEFDTICITYQNTFNAIDNTAYFTDVADRLKGKYSVKHYPTDIFPVNSFLIAQHL